MPGWTLREFDCTHCGGKFTDMGGDLMVPAPRLCDDCLRTLWPLSDEELDKIEIAEENLLLLIAMRENRSLDEILAERNLFRGE